MVMHICCCFFLGGGHSLFQHRVPHWHRQQAVNIVCDWTPLDEQEYADHHGDTHTQPHQGTIGLLWMQKSNMSLGNGVSVSKLDSNIPV